tara:strand:+ start:2518 stop:2694 length:177 start_codon:yes stop_codon:yes gene_type:complete
MSNKNTNQLVFFGFDNLQFKTINLPKPQKFKYLDNKFGLKKVINSKQIKLNFFKLKFI